ncbi:MAG: hypothetical protein COA54_09955 [Thiotrichaceae bacterium]|nr:MAG: hypothetical protein COA54_09955 [Thiotrichaceae bacterium]
MKNKSAKKWLGIATVSAIAMCASVAQAAIIETEGNDTFATANAGAIPETLTGSIGDASAVSNDVDIWSFNLNAGQFFGANISYTGLYNEFDVNPIMTLFMENGGSYFAVASTDPDSFGTSLSFTTWASGNYFLSISADFNNAEDAFGNNQSDSSFFTTEDILGTAFNNFNGGSFTSFDYQVGVVPVPAAVWLFGSGLLGLVGVARRRSHKA